MFGDQDKMVDQDKEMKKFVKFQHYYKIIHLIKLVVDIITLQVFVMVLYMHGVEEQKVNLVQVTLIIILYQQK